MDSHYREIIEKNVGNRVVGLREVLRRMTEGRILLVVLAADAEEHIKGRVKAACTSAAVSAVNCGSMEELDRLAGIEVPCAVVGILREAAEA